MISPSFVRPFVILATVHFWSPGTHAEVEVRRVLSVSIPGADGQDPNATGPFLEGFSQDVRLINPQGFSTGPNGSLVAAGRLTGPGISPQDRNDTVLVYLPKEGENVRVIGREGEPVGLGTFELPIQASIDSSGSIAALIKVRDSENEFSERYAVRHGQPGALTTLEYGGRPVTIGDNERQIQLFPRLRHSRRGDVAFITDAGFNEQGNRVKAIHRGNPPLVSVAPAVEVGRAYEGLPEGASLRDIDEDFLMDPSGRIVFTGSYCVPAEDPEDPPVCYRGIFAYDRSMEIIAVEGETSWESFSLGGHSIGAGGHLTFRAQPGSAILYYAPGEELTQIDLPGSTIVRTGMGPTGNVLIWAFEDEADSLWLWSPFEEPRLLVREGETMLPFRNDIQLEFSSFSNAAIGPEDRVALSGRAFRGNFSFDAVWMTDEEGNWHFVGDGGELPPFELDINNFVNGLGNGADGRNAAFFDDGSLLARIDATVFVAEVVPPVPNVRISMHRIASRSGYDDISIELGRNLRDADLEPVNDPAILETLPEISTGLVTDGVTPLVFRFEATEGFIEQAARYRIDVNVVSGGRLELEGPSHLRTLRNGGWGGTGFIDLTPDQTIGYAYLAAIDAEDVRLEDATELQARVAIYSEVDTVPIHAIDFRIRRPPLLLVPDWPAAGWGDAFLNELYKSYPRDFVRPLDPWQVAAEWDEEEGEYEYSISLLGEFEGDPVFAELETNWALTRADVVGHGRGGIIAATFAEDLMLHRGFFRRGIALGTSQLMPPRIPQYFRLLAQKVQAFESPAVRSLLSFVPQSLEALSWKHERWIYRGRPGQHSRTPFHLMGTQLALEVATFPDLFLFSGLTRTRLEITAPDGSDGLVAVDETLTNWTAPELTLLSESLAHRGPESAFGGAGAQTHSPTVALRIVELLEDDGSKFRLLRSIHADYYRSEVRIELVNSMDGLAEIALRDLFAAALRGVLAHLRLETTSEPDPVTGTKAFTYALEPSVDYPPNESPPVFLAEVYGEHGVTREGVSISTDPSNPNRVELQVASEVRGDVVLFASYATSEEGLMLAEPTKAVTVEPETPATGIDVSLGDVAVETGDVIVPDIHTLHGDGMKLRRWIAPSDGVTAQSSDPAVVDTSDPLKWEIGEPGTATVSVSYKGWSTDVSVQVASPRGVRYEAWQITHFSPDELADESISGFLADPDNDAFPNGAEFYLNGDPKRRDRESFITATTVEIDGNRYGALQFQFLTAAEGVSATVQISNDLENWRDLYEIGSNTADKASLVASEQVAGEQTYLTIREDLPMEPGKTRHFRLKVITAAP